MTRGTLAVNGGLGDLSEAQRRVVCLPAGPVLVLAAAGSGKTRVICHRVAWWVASGTARPEQVLAITFTNRAAGELAERLAALVGGAAAAQATCGTFHSVCHRVLRAHARLVDRTPRFSIYDQAAARRALAEAARADAQAVDIDAVARSISLAKARLLTPERLRVEGEEPVLAAAWARYERLLRDADALDFDDLIATTVRLLARNAEVARQLRARWQAVVVDEYQDTNRAQYALLRLLGGRRPNLTAVADDDQAIYAFRGADVGCVRALLVAYPHTQVSALEHNFRCSGAIVRAAAAVVTRNRARMPKQLRSGRAEGSPVRVEEHSDEGAEAHAAARWCAHHVEQGRPPAALALLFRTHRSMRPVEEALLVARVPHRVLGGLGFFDRAEIRDALAHLMLLVNPRDRVAFARAVTTPRRGLGPKAVDRLTARAGEHGGDLLAACLHADGLAGLSVKQQRAAENYGRALRHVRAGRGGVGATVAQGLLASGLPAWLQQRREGERVDALRDLVRAARAYDHAVDVPIPSLGDFLARAALLGRDAQDRADQVTLATVHAAKGLEWPRVRVLGLEEGQFPHHRSAGQPAGLEEERRLAYVAMTRAHDELVLSWARVRHGRAQQPSRFLSEAGLQGGRPHAA